MKKKIIKLKDELKIVFQQLNEEKEKNQMINELKKIYLNKQKEYEQYKVDNQNKIKKCMEDNSKLLEKLNEWNIRICVLKNKYLD